MKRKQASRRAKKKSASKVRYAVVGLGYIAQGAVLPAFKNAKNSELTALVSDDPKKLKVLGRKYRVDSLWSYDQYEECLRSDDIDAVYIALPNDMHAEFSVAAAEAGIHILCEKPLAVTPDECEEMIEAARENGVKLMTAYRLHNEQANLKAVQLAKSKKLGEPRLFSGVFTMQVKDPDNIRLKSERGGGPLFDIGIYCLNAARSLFQDDPTEVFAFEENSGDSRFKEVEEAASVVLRFPKNRLASFTCSFGAADVSSYRLVGTKGDLLVSPAYNYSEKLAHELTIGEKKKKFEFPKSDQFGAMLTYFSDCILKNKEPEPSGLEGLADVRVISAIHESLATGEPVTLEAFPAKRRPHAKQHIHKPPVEKPELVHAEAPH